MCGASGASGEGIMSTAPSVLEQFLLFGYVIMMYMHFVTTCIHVCNTNTCTCMSVLLIHACMYM